jgi:hypothetical protein
LRWREQKSIFAVCYRVRLILQKHFAPRTRQLFVCALVLFLSFLTVMAAPKFTASLDKETTSLGESVDLTLKFEDAEPKGRPRPPALDGLNIVGQTQSQNISLINGQMRREYSFTYTLMPTREGEIVIPAMQLEVDGQKLTSQAVRLKVVKSAAPPAGENGSPPGAFLKLIVPKNEIFVGEVIPAEIRLYYQDARNPSLPQLSSEGFTIGTMPQNPEQTVTQMNGARYSLIIFRFPVTAVKPGTLVLGPATLPITLLLGLRGTDFFGQKVFTEARPVTLSSEAQSMVVHPLPKENVPATFNGAIGKFNLHVEAAPTNVGVGDPITVKVQISGSGALDAISLPVQASWREFKTYTPSSKVDPSDALGLNGTKTFEEVVSPQNADIKELPAFEFSFFDPEQKVYQTLTTPAVPLSVHPTSATPQPTIVTGAPSASENQPAPKEVVHIKAYPGVVGALGVPLIRQPAFLVLQALAPALWLGSIFFRRRKESLANNPKLRRRRQVERLVREGLQQLSALAADNKSEEFFATTFRLLQEQLGETLDVPASGITEAVVEEQLKPRAIKPETLSLLHELFQTCNQARYAAHRSKQELTAFIPKVERALLELQKQ